MSKTLGIDLGTNSIGMTLRNDDFFEWYGVYTFRKGVGDGKSGEFSLAAERTTNRSSRRLYNARRYRKWETLKVLIENGFCPLRIDKLNKWKNYEKGVGRIFPVNDTAFREWIKLDFNGDGKPDYPSPYQLRRELILQKLNINNEEDRHKIGRALYHIAQRRGFKSSRKVGSNEKTAVYKGSKETGTIGRNTYEQLIEENGSLGAALAHLEDEGIRIRNRYTLRSDYLNEVNKILDLQGTEQSFKEKIVKAIFFQRPLRSQKGLVGKCTMEPNKPRCPISHSQLELYRAWSFVNNIKYRIDKDEKFESLPLSLKQEIVEEKLLIKSNKTTFKTIRNFICRNERKNWELNYSLKMDKMTVSTCPVSAHLKAAFGDNWNNVLIQSEKTRTDKNGSIHKISYSIEDIWHIAFSFEDEEYYEEFLIKQLKLEEEQIDQLKKLWNALPTGYANLSLKAINNILPFLKEGIIYSEAVFLAKIPDVIGKEFFDNHKEGILEALHLEIANNRHEKTIINIANSLIADYKVLPDDGKFGYKNIHYRLDDLDKKDILNACIKYFGKNRWDKFEREKQINITDEVSGKYQEFFATSKRDYFKQPKLVESIQKFLMDEFNVSEEETGTIYHPSMIDIYPSSEDQRFLKSPKTRAFKNPMAYKTLHNLRHVINHLIEKGLIDSETRVMVEVARELNNKNKRAAIEDYQRNRERENLEFGLAISELIKDPEFRGSANPNSKNDKDKFRLWTEQIENNEEVVKQVLATKDSIKKYRLWKEQKCICFYTGKPIRLTDLFNNNIIDFEHTIPQSKSFDNSLANLTVCYANYNRDIKKNRIPIELPNYKEESHGFTAIEPRLKEWKDKIESLYSQIQTQVKNSKNAMDKDAKDSAIRRRHLLQMEYDYWKNKVDRFTREDVPSGFRNSQLKDTQLISKYAYHYLKTVFNQVDTVKGDTTSQFRKIYGVQPKFETKDRSKHYHHAIDAAVLTLLPTSAKRKDILEMAYKFEEANPKKQYHEKPFEGFNNSMITKIENEILIHNIKDQDQTLTPSRKYVRKRGRIEYLRDENGNYLRDENGKRIPKVATGDAVRGKLHKETFYGKIKVAAKDEEGALLRNETGEIQYLKDKNGNEVYYMVGRKQIEDVSFKTDLIVDEHLATHLRAQIESGVKQNELKDFQGKTIRHLRCVVKSGRGVMNPDNVTIVKEQTYESDKEYKNYYYADSGDNYMFGLYENEYGRKIVSINTLEATRLSLNQNEDFKREIFKSKEPVLIGRGKKAKEGNLIHIFTPGQKVLFFFEDKEELQELYKDDKKQFTQRLYLVKKLADANAQRILFQHHLEARNDEQLMNDFPKSTFGTKGKDGFSSFPSDFVAPRLLLTPTKFNFIIEKRDFEIELDGSINWKF
ncbi:MAG: type II CRISPR RNA-guided endonuclease Cas9 [Bacteroidota bacterium]